MKAKNSSRKHGAKLSFVVDREEIDINSDWVSAVLRSPGKGESAPVSANNTTVEQKTTDKLLSTVVQTTPVEQSDPVEQISTVEKHSTDERDNSVVNSPPVVEIATVAPPNGQGKVEHIATVESPATLKSRKNRPRLIRSILDGFTPGQFTVYSLMWQKGEDSGAGNRLFAGGYRALCDLTGMSKRGVQNVIAELQEKQAISIHQAPGYHRSQFSVYQVLSEEHVLRIWRSRGYQYAVGKGKTLTSDATVA